MNFILSHDAMELIPRSQTVSLFYGIGIFLSLALLFFANIWNQNIIKNGFTAFFKLHNIDDYVKKSYPLFNQSGALIFLSSLISVVLAFSLLVPYISFDGQTFSQFTISLFSLTIFCAPLIVLLFLLWLSSKYKQLSSLLIFHILSFYLFGALCLFNLLFWALFKADPGVLHTLTISALTVVIILRWVKTLLFVLKLYIPWYYIILYFCTLEFLPALYLLHMLT